MLRMSSMNPVSSLIMRLNVVQSKEYIDKFVKVSQMRRLTQVCRPMQDDSEHAFKPFSTSDHIPLCKIKKFRNQ